MIKKLNNLLEEKIDKSKSFEDQTKLLKKAEGLSDYWGKRRNYDDKKLKFRFFKLSLADLSNIIDKKIFEQIFGHTFETLASKLINTTKEENQIIVNNIEKNRDKLYEEDDDDNYLIQPSDRCINLIDAVNLILDFNETIQSDLT